MFLEEDYRNTVVGNDVWIGDNVLICGGCTINDGVIIGAGSIVTRDLESYGIYAGVPAKLIRKRECSYVNTDSIPSEWWELDDHELSYLIKNIMNDLKLSLIFGTLSRVITFVNQVLSVPLTIAIIGINEFTRFNVITAGIAWLITVGGCLLPSLVGDISRAKEDHNDIMISEKISSALTVMVIFIITVMIGYIFFFGVMDNERNLLLIFSILILLFSTAENVRQGLGENYKNAIYNGCSNLLSLVIILGLAYFEIKTNLQMVIIVMFGSITFLNC